MKDHRKLGRELELFHSDPLVGAGLPLWLPAGAAIRHAIESYLYEVERLAGYQHVFSPPIAKQQMYVQSGHLANFSDDMFPPMVEEGGEAMMLRPSLCPHHCMVFRARGRSFRELPLRIAELGGMYRSERSGVLGGLSRVRSIWLNDAHVFCPPSLVGQEVSQVLAMALEAHRVLGFRVERFRLSLRGPGEKYLGEPREWERAEGMLREALVAAEVKFDEEAGEAAFYGPKIDMQVRDILGREFSIATIQVDFALPQRFDLSYVDSGGAGQRPVMVHRSLVGGMERLLAHLIEVHQGAFPVWYAPMQLAVLPVGADQVDSAHRLAQEAMRRGLRAEVRAEGSLGLRLREVISHRVPYAAVLGAQEVKADSVSLRLRDGSQPPPMPRAEALALIESVAAQRLSGLSLQNDI
jgi:threonyl-tRNA synthetase